MRLSFRLSAIKDLRKNKKKKVEGRRRSIVKADLKSNATCREIPEDVLIEILVRLPAYSLMRFKCVSRFWYSLISSRYFTNLFYKFSLSIKREPRVFMYVVDDNGHSMLFSSPTKRTSCSNSTTSFLQLNQDLTLPGIENCFEFLNALRGMMCFRVGRLGRDIRIINLTTSQVLSLPPVESNLLLEGDDSYVWNNFGYDPVNDEYKILSIIISTDETNEWRTETKVLVLGDGASWRNTKSCTSSPRPHDVDEVISISINDVLYYGAWSHEERSVLMSFDFNSEDFNLIELPTEYRIKQDQDLFIVYLMNYQDQVAVFDDSRLYTEINLDLWVLEDERKSKWSHKVLVLPCHQIRVSLNLDIDDIDDLYIKGTGRRGEITLVNGNNKSAHAFYDLEKNRITRGVVFESPYPNYDFVPMCLWEDLESIMYL